MHRVIWVIILAGLALAGCLGRRGELRPLNPAAVPPPLLIGQPQLVTFAELGAEPTRYQDTLLRVTGVFYHLPPPGCIPANGVPAEWALVDSGLRLDAAGLEAQVRLAAEAVPFTVDGILRLYQGPIGCGKEPPAGTAWYFEALQIIQPNPLMRSDRPPGFDVVIVVPTIPGPSLVPITGTPVPGGTPTRTTVPTGAAQPTQPATGTPPAGTPPVTASPTVRPGGTPTPGPSPTAGGTASPAPTVQPTDGAPPTATTGGGYPPPPGGTVAPPATPPGYP